MQIHVYITDNIKKKASNPFHKIQLPNANRILIQSIRLLRRTLYLKTQNVGRKIVLVFDAHLLNSGQGEAANAFLKILEEPPSNTTIILVTDYMELLLPTILSRCQKIAFPKLNNEYLEEWCSINKVKKAHVPLVIGLSEGDVHKAKLLISQPLEKTMRSISSLIKVISEKELSGNKGTSIKVQKILKLAKNFISFKVKTNFDSCIFITI